MARDGNSHNPAIPPVNPAKQPVGRTVAGNGKAG
jgi:hypothetical protein